MRKIRTRVAGLIMTAAMVSSVFAGVSFKSATSVYAATTTAEMKLMDENGPISAITSTSSSANVTQVTVDDTNPSTTTITIPRAEDIESEVDADVATSLVVAAALKFDVQGPHYFYRFKFTNSVYKNGVTFEIYYQNEYSLGTKAGITSQQTVVGQGNVAEVTTKLDQGVRNTGKYGYGTYYVVAYTGVAGNTVAAPVQIEISSFYDDILDTMDDAVTEADSKLTVDKSDYPSRTDLMTPGKTGSINCREDVDVYYFTSDEYTSYTVTLSAKTSDGINVSVRDISGANRSTATLNAAGGTTTAIATGLDQNTSYYIFVSGTAENDYTLKVDHTTYPITYETNGGGTVSSKAPTSYVATKGVSFGTVTAERDGYVFMGWYGDVNCQGTPVTSVSTAQTGKVIVYAKWGTISTPSISASAVKGGKAQVKWSVKSDENISGYEIQYSMKKNFKKAKTVKTTSKSSNISKLKKNKKYFIRVRAYYKDGSLTSYGKYSAVKKIKAIA